MMQDALASGKNIKIVIRLKPNPDCADNSCIVPLSASDLQIAFGSQTSTLSYHHILPQASAQADVFSQVSSIVQAALAGHNGSILAYGQTGGGKTHTLIGEVFNSANQGIVPRTAHEIFGHIENLRATGEEINVQVSAVEIYCERIRDLLCLSQSSDNLTVQQDRETGMFIAGAKRQTVTSEDELLFVTQQALGNRAVAATGMNASSSRSHCLILLHLCKGMTQEAGRSVYSKLCLVDLAGSERHDRTLATGLTLEEGKLINKGLSALGNVVSTLVDNKRGAHIPYRNSKLTRVLQDSIGGNTFTAIVVCCSTSKEDSSESLAALRFASRAAGIVNPIQIKSPKADAKDAENVKRLQGQLEAAQQEQVLLRGEVRRLQALSGVTHAPDTEVEDDTFASGAKALVKQLSTTFRTIWLILVIGLAIMDA